MQQNKMKHNKTTTNLRVPCSIPRSSYLPLGIRRTCCVFVGLAHFASGLQIARHVGSLHSWWSQLLGIWQWPLRRLYDMLQIWIGGCICSPRLVNHVPHGLLAVLGLFRYIVTQYADIPPNFLLTIPNQSPRVIVGWPTAHSQKSFYRLVPASALPKQFQFWKPLWTCPRHNI